MKIKNARIFDAEKQAFVPGGMVWENGTISRLCPCEDGEDWENDLVIPGLTDMHTHGREGAEFISADVPELHKLRDAYARIGVTTVVPTLASDTLENMLAAVTRIREAGFSTVHLEGRYLNPARRGAHGTEYLAPLRKEELELFFKAAGEMHLHVSAAYELDGDGSFLKAVTDGGGTAGLAHTDATFSQAQDAVSRGVSCFTHLFNAMPPIHHRSGGAAMAGLLSDTCAEVICDGFHLAPETVRLVHKMKTEKRVILITDSMAGAGCADNEYLISGHTVTVRDGRAYTEQGTIAGSTLDLLTGVKNYAKFCRIPFAEAVNCAAANPADLLGLDGAGRLLPGYRADFLRLSPDLKLKEVYADGCRIR